MANATHGNPSPGHTANVPGEDKLMLLYVREIAFEIWQPYVHLFDLFWLLNYHFHHTEVDWRVSHSISGGL